MAEEEDAAGGGRKLQTAVCAAEVRCQRAGGVEEDGAVYERGDAVPGGTGHVVLLYDSEVADINYLGHCH